MATDVSGYYSALGLDAGASIDAVRAAFRRLAKECHPDRPSCVDGGQRFRRIAEAYEALSDSSFKAAYDSGANASSEKSKASPPPPPKVEPVRCEVCGRFTAQPRRLAFWRVTSFILASQKAPVQKIFCHACAAKEQWRSTLWTGLLGWWGVPWGPIWATGHGATNATGGTRQQSIDDALLWQNAVAFAARGDGAVAIGLSNVLRRSDNAEIAQRAAEIIQFFSARGFDAAATLKDVWKRSFAQTIGLFAAAFAAPIVVLTLIFIPSIKGAQPSAATPQWSVDQIQAGGAAVTATAAPTALPMKSGSAEPICVSPPANGQVLVDHRGQSASGHHLKIENGTAGDAIVKMRAADGHTVASFFVARGNTATLTRIPDGSYTVQYASGDKLAKNCRRFVSDRTASASEFPGPDILQTRYEQDLDGTSVIHSELTFTLFPVPGGTITPNTINLQDFDKP